MHSDLARMNAIKFEVKCIIIKSINLYLSPLSILSLYKIFFISKKLLLFSFHFYFLLYLSALVIFQLLNYHFFSVIYGYYYSTIFGFYIYLPVTKIFGILYSRANIQNSAKLSSWVSTQINWNWNWWITVL